MTKELLKGNIAFAEAAVRAGVDAYFGYPITPQTEALEYLSHRMPALGRAFVQAESELGAINMVYGAACTGRRTMTSSSSPGVSLMMEGLSYIAGTEIPMVLVDVMRGGPGLGNIAPAQSDYKHIVHGGGHGDYYPIVLAPANIQETIDLTYGAFELAEKYRSIVVILIDGSIGQMMEPAELPPMKPRKKQFPEWATDGCEGRPARFLTSISLDPPKQEITNLRILKRWQEARANEVICKEYFMEDARYAVVGFGTAGRVALSAVRTARAEGIPVGLVRPVSLHPFPEEVMKRLSKTLDGMLVVEMNNGQMLDDVLVYTKESLPISFIGRPGGVIPMAEEIYSSIQQLVNNPPPIGSSPRDRWFAKVCKEKGL
ncbi:MAG: 3-methyl-2-oxobutanoate dehydrogenase subunit VorB [Anaerolineaceae bacterium]|nr:3-methyl-2-oxobutanoate dehydrogenase subunit VorB [Anaerolineaceae bacterium]